MSLNLEKEGVLYGLACECENLFDQVLEALNTAKADTGICQLYIEFQQRFAIWAAHLGVFARTSQCLDRRLRNFPDLQDIVSRLLDILRRTLFECIVEIKSKAGKDSPTSRHGGALEPGPSQVETARIRAIDDVIARLSRFGVTIRHSDRPNIDSKVKKFIAGHDLKPFSSLCERAVQSLYPGAHPSLQEHLCNSMTDRYARMLFLDSRHKKLETRRELPSESTPRPPGRNKERTTNPPISQGSRILKTPNIATNFELASSTPSQSDLSSVNIQMIRDRIRQSHQASASLSSRKSSTVLVNQTNYPKLPTYSDDSKVFKCEWCAQLVNKSLLSAKDWRQHVDRDLRPYVCLSERCPEGHPAYPTFDEWNRHMQFHSRRWHQNTYLTSGWFCTICDSSQKIYDHPQGLYAHLDQNHSATFPPEQLQAISRQSKTENSRARNDCLLCCFSLEEQYDEAIFPKRRKGLLKQEASKSPRHHFYGDNPGPRDSNSESSCSSSETESEDSMNDLDIPQLNINRPQGITKHIAGHLQVLMILTTRFGTLMNQDEGFDGDINSDSVDVDGGDSDSEKNDVGKISDIASSEDYPMKEMQNPSTAGIDPDLDDSYGEDHLLVPDTDFDIEVIPRQHDNLRPEDDMFIQGVLESGAYRVRESVTDQASSEEATGKTETYSSLSSLWNYVNEYFIEQNDLETTKILESRADDGQTPLSWVAARGWLPLAQALLKEGANPNVKDKWDGRTALHIATLFGHLDIVHELLENGADVNARDVRAETPLHIAVTHQRLGIAIVLLDYGAEINAINRDGITPLCVAASKGACEVARLILSGEAEINYQGPEGQTPLSLASANGHQEVASLLLNHGAEVNLADERLRTPLSFASANGHEEVVKLLLFSGADVERRDMNGKRPQSFASDEGYETIVRLLLESNSSSITRRRKNDGHSSIFENVDSMSSPESLYQGTRGPAPMEERGLSVGLAPSADRTSKSWTKGLQDAVGYTQPTQDEQSLALKLLIDSEAVFVRDMTILKEIYKGTSEVLPMVDAKITNLLFGNCDKILEFHNQFLNKLRIAAAPVYSRSSAHSELKTGRDSNTEDRETAIGSVFEANMAEMKAVHQKFMQNRDQRIKTLNQLRQESAVRTWLEECRKAGEDMTKRPDIDSLIEQPIQHINDYQMLLAEVIKNTPQDQVDKDALRAVMESLAKMYHEIQQTQKDHGLARQVLDNTQNDSNLTHIIGRRVDKIRVRGIEIPEDQVYSRLRGTLNRDYFSLQICLRDVESYVKQVSTYMDEILGYASSMELMMRLQLGNYSELESRWVRFNSSLQDFKKVNLEQHIQQIRERVISPVEHVFRAYENPLTAIKKRQKLRLNYEQAEQLKQDDKKPSSGLMRLVEQYVALNNTLKRELPILSSLTKRMCQISLENLVMIQKDWYSAWKEELKAPLETSPNMPDMEDLVSTFKRDFSFARRNLMSLSILSSPDETPDVEFSTPSKIQQIRSTPGRVEQVKIEPADRSLYGGLEKRTMRPMAYSNEARNSIHRPDENQILWLAASLFEFNMAETKIEGGYPYLTYQAGEIFDVVGEKGELWLAKNQDDPTNQVGWIWSKHFAKLADKV